jgi:hypothetical protein
LMSSGFPVFPLVVGVGLALQARKDARKKGR